MRARPDVTARRWALVRALLGVAQMTGAAVAAVLLARSGVTPASLAAGVATSLLTTVSVLLFGSAPARSPRRSRGAFRRGP